MNGLTVQDYETLIEAVQAWQSSESLNNLNAGLLGSMMARSKDESRKAMDECFVKLKDDDDPRKERAILLQAKLIGLRDAAVAVAETCISDAGAQP